MKKKGLLILPLAMMLIIAVALSTATYAWFAVSADAKISTLTVQTSASDGLQIASIYNDTAKSGSMTLTTGGTKIWDGATAGYGPELSFTTAMASAYGVTGNGLKDSMYTAASRTATSYQTVPTDAAWWAENEATLTGSEVYYSNSTGMTLAASSGYFTLGVFSGDELDKEDVITTGNSSSNFFIRAQAYPTIQVTGANASSYTVANTFYSDSTGLTLANDATYFVNGIWQEGGTLAADIASYTIATSNNIYVRSSQDTIPIETGWNYEANNGALNGSSNPYYLVPATANSEYFALNFALKTQRGMVGSSERQGIADIFLKKLNVTASGGMAAASRIAIYSYNSTYTTPTLQYFYIPFSKSAYDATWTNILAEPQTGYRIKGDAAMEGAGFAYSASEIAELTPAKIIADASAVYDADQWQTAMIYNIDKNTTWATKSFFDAAQATPSTKLDSLGTFSAANTVLYYQMVIWFEGTDAECVGSFAGTGITVDLAFDFYQRWV